MSMKSERGLPRLLRKIGRGLSEKDCAHLNNAADLIVKHRTTIHLLSRKVDALNELEEQIK